MICPKCGRPMPEDTLYCENCGEEIHIVPEFDLELEQSIAQGMESLKAGVGLEVGLEQEPQAQPEAQAASSKVPVSSLSWMGGMVLVLVVLVCVSGAGFLYFRYHSLNYQLNQARIHRERMELEEALAMYKRAVSLSPEEGEIRLLLAETYGLMGLEREEENTLLQITDQDVFSQESRIKAYGRLALIYQEKEAYEDLSNLLNSCKIEAVRKKFAAFLVTPPVFSFEEGEYREILPLKLISTLPGEIYYTLDGGNPLTEGELYTGPIFLDKGDYVVSACVISDKGVESQVVTKKYKIEVDMVPAPDIYPASGTYSGSMMIRVASGSERDIYYTTDGTEPNMHSEYFTGRLPIPLGESHYRFAYITEDGRSSLIADLDYSIVLGGSVTKDMALKILMDYMVASGKVYDDQGHVTEDSGATYGARCTYSIALGGLDYYILEEIYTDEAGLQTCTGSLYGVEADTGQLFRARQEGDGTYLLTEPLSQQ